MRLCLHYQLRCDACNHETLPKTDNRNPIQMDSIQHGKFSKLPDSTSTSFYTPLDISKSQIRLIHIRPRSGSDSNTIICTLQLADLDDETCVYDALSYEWGVETDNPPLIILNGQETPIRENLWQALRTMGSKQSNLPIWIDALCINQKNDVERSSQVSMMGQIYQRASCVIAWLGTDVSLEDSTLAATQEAFQLAELLYGTSKSDRYYYRPEAAYWRPYQYASSVARPNVPITYQHPGWTGVFSLCQRSYWTRLWILQELVLATRIIIQIGQLQLNWAALEHIHDQITNAKQVGGNNLRLNYYAQATRSNKMVQDLSGTVPFKILQQRVARRAISHELYTLFELVQMYKSAECVDVRDKVFGLIGLCSQCCRENVVVDYQRTPLDTCRMLLEHYLSRHSIHGLNLKNGSNVDLFTLVKEVVAIFTDGGNEFPLPVTGDPFPEVSEGSKPDSVAMIACSPRCSISLEFQGDINHFSRVFFDRHSGKGYVLRLLHLTGLPDPTHKYWMCKINGVQLLILRELHERLCFVGIAQDTEEEYDEPDLAKAVNVQVGEHVQAVEEMSSKMCLYLNFRALTDVTLVLNRTNVDNPICLLLSWNCLSCDYCWNRRFYFGIKPRWSLAASDAKMIQDFNNATQKMVGDKEVGTK
ncbi:hypothetical protein ONS95_001159 [Cadophora gregata]|uniref:uncharacterized protein n=1 Tax=Cadophora gregata TaxID=51156 RepID=UPI0026DB621D|nr:uncharacterized protein ONS95_001159 [Cadophora gregata]KAK0129224.1 hypothetical protein ONS95_001159 [Cadophora gregata]